MTFSKSISLLVPVFLICMTSIVQAQENFKVTDIRILGNETVDEDAILSVMDTYTIGWIPDNIFGKEPGYYSEEILEKDLHAIYRLCQREGFLRARIGPVTLLTDEEDRTLEIEIPVSEGIPVLVDTVMMQFAGSSHNDSAKLDSLWKHIAGKLVVKRGDRFRDSQLRSDRSAILTVFMNAGFPYVTVEFDLAVSDDREHVSVLWTIETGPLSVFGEISISGSERFDKEIVKEKLKFESGQHFSNALLNHTQSALYGLGLFQIVTIKVLTDRDKTSVVPVEVRVTDASKYKIRFGVGYGRDEKFRFSTDFTVVGFLGMTGRLNVKFRRSELEPYRLAVSYTHPDFLLEDMTFIVNPFTVRQNEPGYKTEKRGSNFSLQRLVFRDIQGSVTWTLEGIDLDTNSVSYVNKEGDLRAEYGLSFLTFGLNRITSLPVFNPIGGMFVGLLYTYSSAGLGSSYEFYKVILDLRKYSFVAKWLTLAYRVKFGALQGTAGNTFIPVTQRFFAGGASSVRGWGRHELGPVDANNVPIGGLSLFEASLETRFPLYYDIGGVAFMDFGNTWMQPWTYNMNELRYSLGAGLRYNTPIGPVRIDVARPVFDEHDKWQFFFSIGHAF